MNVCVLGAGVVGLATAWFLAERGINVTIVDRRKEPGAETSHGNGGQLSYSYVAPFASPSFFAKLPRILMGRDEAIQVRAGLDTDFLRWGIKFLACCKDLHTHETLRAQLALASSSRRELERLVRELDLRFDFAEAGKLVIFKDAKSLKAAERQVAIQAGFGQRQTVLSATECLSIEPALRVSTSSFAGGVYTPTEQVGNCAAFCKQLFDHLVRNRNVTVVMGANVVSPILSGGVTRAIQTDFGPVEADRFVVAFGPGSLAFCKQMGFRIPIYPVKGYSVTLRPRSPDAMPRRSVTDANAKIVIAPFGVSQVRVAGGVDFVGKDLTLDASRIELITRRASELFELDLDGDWSAWCGLRPATPDSRPIVGPSPARNVYLNTGHGALGWTLACGSAKLIADVIASEPQVDPLWFSLSRRDTRAVRSWFSFGY